jgi:hypothetical protein
VPWVKTHRALALVTASWGLLPSKDDAVDDGIAQKAVMSGRVLTPPDRNRIWQTLVQGHNC